MTDFRQLCANIVKAADAPYDGAPDGAEGDFLAAIDEARAVLARYGAQTVPVASSNICTGCDTPRHEAIAAIANGAMSCCPDCSTLTVEDRNAIRAIKAVPLPAAERLPGERDCDAEGRCWFVSSVDPLGPCWQLDAPSWLKRQAPDCDDRYTHWLPHWALPLPEAQP